MKNIKEYSKINGMKIRIKLYNEISNIYKNKLLDFLNVKFIAINGMDSKYEFKKGFKQHLYYNIFQNPPGVLSFTNDLTFLKDITLQNDLDLVFIKDLRLAHYWGILVYIIIKMNFID